MTDAVRPAAEVVPASDGVLSRIERVVDATKLVQLHGAKWRASADTVEDPFDLLGSRDHVRVTELRFGAGHVDVHMTKREGVADSKNSLPVRSLYRSSLQQMVARTRVPFDYYRATGAEPELSPIHTAWDRSEEGRNALESHVATSALYAEILVYLAEHVAADLSADGSASALSEFFETVGTVAKGATAAVRRLNNVGQVSEEALGFIDLIDEVIAKSPQRPPVVSADAQALVAAHRALRLP
jgi:hypothetical protein